MKLEIFKNKLFKEILNQPLKSLHAITIVVVCNDFNFSKFIVSFPVSPKENKFPGLVLPIPTTVYNFIIIIYNCDISCSTVPSIANTADSTQKRIVTFSGGQPSASK